MEDRENEVEKTVVKILRSLGCGYEVTRSKEGFCCNKCKDEGKMTHGMKCERKPWGRYSKPELLKERGEVGVAELQTSQRSEKKQPMEARGEKNKRGRGSPKKRMKSQNL